MFVVSPLLEIQKAKGHLNNLEEVVSRIQWIHMSIKSQLQFGDGDFNKFQYIVSKSLLAAADKHRTILADIRITTKHTKTIMGSHQTWRLERLMWLVEDYESDMMKVELVLRVRVSRNAARFPLAWSQ